MTLEEYKKLVHKYKTTDSISKKKKLESELLTTLIALTKQLESLYRKYGDSFIDDSDWRETRGSYKLDYVNDDEAVITYGDSWAYGGYCDISITIPTEFFNIEERNKKEEELKQYHIKRLKESLTNIDSNIEKLQKEKEDIISKLKAYGQRD